MLIEFSANDHHRGSSGFASMEIRATWPNLSLYPITNYSLLQWRRKLCLNECIIKGWIDFFSWNSASIVCRKFIEVSTVYTVRRIFTDMSNKAGEMAMFLFEHELFPLWIKSILFLRIFLFLLLPALISTFLFSFSSYFLWNKKYIIIDDISGCKRLW